MRFTVSVDSNWTVTITPSVPIAGWNVPARALDVAGKRGSGAFPLPPVADRPPDTEPHAAMCKGDLTALKSAQTDIMNRRVATSEAYGRYLFDTLIGITAWNAIVAEAAVAKARVVELALEWLATDGDLHRLPWELMRAPIAFLVASRVPRVAITRVVAGTAAVPSQLDLPPRVLFVIGTAETDPEIRPGAELLGLLRQLKNQARAVAPRVLERASPKRLREVLESFKPQIVHFICHGELDSKGRGFLELQADEGQPDPRRFGDQLLVDLDVNGQLPQIVVLSACKSGTMLSGQESAPLAAQLVTGGVPIVVAMAGRVSDLACRLFTRRFGEAIIGGEPLLEATAEARRVPFASGMPPHTSIDWAYPAVFVSAAVPAGYAPTPPPATPDLTEVWVQNYDVDRQPVFCGRQDILADFDRIVGPGDGGVLAVFGDSDFGKSRILLELTAGAIRNGHIPFLIGSDSKTWEPPRTIDDFIAALRDSIALACGTFGIDPPVPSQLTPLSPLNIADPNMSAAIKYALGSATKATPAAVQLALRADLLDVAKRVGGAHTRMKDGRPIVLLDAIHKYDKELLTALFEGKLLGHFGFGGSPENRIPAVLTFSVAGPALDFLKSVVETPLPRPWLLRYPLNVFRPDGEDLLAYERVLLHPFNLKLLPNFSDRPWAVAADADPAMVNTWRDNFRDLLEGRPKNLTERILYVGVKLASAANYLREANDEDALRLERK
jgi:hypothetical protein